MPIVENSHILIIATDGFEQSELFDPRDAMIALSSPPEELATAFGVHRALDTAGAMLGPLVAFGLLALAPGAFDAIFVVSFCVALIGLIVNVGVTVLGVRVYDVPPFFAKVAGIGTAFLLNFALNVLFVFRAAPADPRGSAARRQ